MKREIHKTHKTDKLGKVAYSYCRQCGLVYLRNLITTQAMRKKCPDKEE